jgi:16S rRNA (adenine1518-N6/adenine1519-N6)-dimethyltransferase
MLRGYVHSLLGALKAKKHLGQHFLVDDLVAEKVASLVEGKVVYEVGSGVGSLTLYMAGKAEYVYGCDVDEVFLDFLKKELARRRIINVDLVLCDATCFENSLSRHVVVSNTPFNISSVLIVKLCYDAGLVEAFLGIQREVAQRVLAREGTGDYGRLSVIAQLCYNVEKLFDVSPYSFYPRPKVYTSFLRLVPRSDRNFAEIRTVEEFTRRVFPYINRKIVKALEHGLLVDRREAEELLDRCNVSSEKRVRELTPREVSCLARIFSEHVLETHLF